MTAAGEVTERVMGSDASRAVGRFRREGPLGYRAATLPDAPIRSTRAEAIADERAWREWGELPITWAEAFSGMAA